MSLIDKLNSLDARITRAESGRTKIINAIKGKGGTAASNSNLEALATAISNIPTGGGKPLPSGLSAIDFGEIKISSDFTTTRQTFSHNLGVVPDMIIVYAEANIATTYSMLCAIRSSKMGWRSSAYNNHMAYHGNSTTSVTWTNSNSTTYGVSNMTTTTFQLASASSSYYWRAGSYKYIAVKFDS